MFNPWGFLESERDAGRLLAWSIGALSYQATKFGHALALADYCDEQRAEHRAVLSAGIELGDMDALGGRMRAMAANRQFIEWKQLAASAGAISLYNFAELIQTTDGLIGQVPTAKEHMDRKTMKAGREAFYTAFPDYADVRFAVAHAGKPFASPEINDQQRVPGAGAMMIECLTDRTLTSTVNGKAVHYSLVQSSLDALNRSAKLIEQAFRPLVVFTDQYNSAQQRETPAPPSPDPSPPQ